MVRVCNFCYLGVNLLPEPFTILFVNSCMSNLVSQSSGLGVGTYPRPLPRRACIMLEFYPIFPTFYFKSFPLSFLYKIILQYSLFSPELKETI